MNNHRFLPTLFLVLSAVTAIGQTSHQYNWNIKFDLSRIIYHYKSIEITAEKRFSPRIGLAVAANYYYELPEVENKDILSVDKIIATSNTDFRISFGANFYNETTPNIFYRTRLSYGKIELQHRKHVCLDMENRNGIAVCNDFAEDVSNRKMQQIMLRGGVVIQIPVTNHFFLDAYADVGIVHYFVESIGPFREDVNLKRIDEEYKQQRLLPNQYSDGALRVNMDAPQLLLIFGLKLNYAF